MPRKFGDYIKASSKKSRRKTTSASNEPKERDEVIEVAFDFYNKWDDRTSSSSSTPLSDRQTGPKRVVPIIPEVPGMMIMIECPICRKWFDESEIEVHAATCEPPATQLKIIY